MLWSKASSHLLQEYTPYNNLPFAYAQKKLAEAYDTCGVLHTVARSAERKYRQAILMTRIYERRMQDAKRNLCRAYQHTGRLRGVVRRSCHVENLHSSPSFTSPLRN